MKDKSHESKRVDNDPPHTVTKGVPAPKFGFAGSGGAEYERIHERDSVARESVERKKDCADAEVDRNEPEKRR